MHVDHIGISSVGFPLNQLGDEGEDCKQPMVCVLVAVARAVTKWAYDVGKSMHISCFQSNYV
jgi:hypothetical protein